MSNDHEAEELRAQLDKDGILIIREFFEDAGQFMEAENSLFSAIARGEAARTDRFVTGRVPECFGELPRNPDVLGLAQTPLDNENIALYMNRLLVKDGHWSGEVGVHQDSPYFHGSDKKVSFFVPWTPMQAREGNGGLIFFSGSHNSGRLMRGRIKVEEFEGVEEIVEDFEPTDLISMDFNTWHYSGAATRTTPRILQQVVFQTSDDGSFAGADLGTPRPTLLSGAWNTRYFSEMNCAIPD